MTQQIGIVAYKAGNIASVVNALARLGQNARLVSDPAELTHIDKLIFPGVGHARPAMEQLQSTGMDKAIRAFHRPVLGICLGMQLMASYSEEGAMQGLGLFPGSIKLFNGRSKVPHMGWNRIYNLKTPLFDGVEEGSHVYFVHSYYMPENGSTIAHCDYEGQFAAAASHKNFFGLQFHPEKSGAAGMKILQRFLEL